MINQGAVTHDAWHLCPFPPPSRQIPDLQTGFEFRADVYKYMNMTLPRKPARRVLFWMRMPHFPRELLNTQEILAVVESYNISYT